MALCRKKRLDDGGIVDHGRERDDVAQTDGWDRLYIVSLVLLYTGVPQRHFLLIVEPVLVVGAQAGI